MRIVFYKYQGAGNDFVMIDNRDKAFVPSVEKIAFLCDRHFGIGADGLILLQQKDQKPLMKYYNSDGNESTMCGNGGRCFVRFMEDLGLVKESAIFYAIDGEHTAQILEKTIKLGMSNVNEIKIQPHYTFLNTGSPHHVEIVDNTATVDVKARGAEVRYSALYPEGCNVNFVEQTGNNQLRIRTYERGVEDETLACGTGVTAAAIALHAQGKIESKHVLIKALGGNLEVNFEKEGKQYKNIYLTGEAERVFKGEINL